MALMDAFGFFFFCFSYLVIKKRKTREVEIRELEELKILIQELNCANFDENHSLLNSHVCGAKSKSQKYY